MDSKHTYQPSHPNNSTASSSNEYNSSAYVNSSRTAESSASPYADSADVVTDSVAPPPYTRYPTEQPRQPQPQTLRQLQPQSQPQREYQSTQYQPATPRQPQTPEYRYQMDLPQDYNGAYGYGRFGGRGMGPLGRRRAMGGGPLHMLMSDGFSNRQYQSRQQVYVQPGYDYEDEMDYGCGRRGRRGLGRTGGGGPLHMLLNEATKRL